MRKGIEFENKIFKNIEFMNEQYKKLYGYQAVFINKFQNNIIPTILNKEYLINLTKILKSNEALLIEHQYEIPRIYQTINFGLTMSDARPDIIRIIPLKKLKDQKIQILNEKGQHIFIEPEAYQNVYGINIFDIKAVDKERVGVKFYGEIHYYLQTFNSFIFENNLQNQFVVLIENNGIIPYDPNPSYVNIDSLVELSIKIDFIATRGLYDNFISLIKELRQQIPIARENISTNLGAHCEKCDFREDCQRTKGIIYEEVTKNDYTEYVLKWDLSKASVDLIPSITPSTAQELKELARSENIQNVYNVIRNMGLSTYPRPLNSELPVLKNKVKSILNQGEVIATENEIFSSSIPKYQTNTISITLETDSTTNFAFAFGMFLDSTMGINSKSEVKDVYGNWWRIWKSYLIKADGKYSSDLIDEIFNELENEVNLEISKSDVIAFAKALHSFENESVNDQKSLSVYTTNDIYKRGKIERKLDKIIARLRIEYVNINYRDTVEGEQVFVFQIIKMIANLLKIVVIMEKYITVEINERIYSVSTAVYYWSQEIVEKLRDIISNHMLEIVKDNALLIDFLLINSWITPSNMVSDPYQLKKVFDLSKFVTQTIGLPLQINYTWHRVAKELLSSFRRPNRRFWAELFNNMDRTQWLNFLQYRDIDQKRANKQFKQIQAQVYNKILIFI